MVKWMGPKTAFDVIHQCLLTFGHYGWSMDLPHQQRMRDVMGLEIGDGTAGIMKLIVARERVGRVADSSTESVESAETKAMKILVPVKRVVDYNIKIRIKADGSGVELANVKWQKFGGARFRI